MGGAGTVAHWSSTGNGTFDNPFALNAIYTASAEDVLVGQVTLTLSVSTNNAACPVASDDLDQCGPPPPCFSAGQSHGRGGEA